MSDLSHCRVLVVDDDEDSRFLLQCLLEKVCQIDVAENPTVGLHKIQNWRPDLVLLDINMPGEDGFSLCRRIRMASDIADTPVIFISASTDADDVLRGFSAGAVDFINKPFDISQVNARVTAQLRQQMIIKERSERLGKVAKDLATLEQSYLFFADHSADILVRCGADTVIRHVNRQWARLTGLQSGSPIGRPVEELAIQADRALLRASLEEALDQRREQIRVEFSLPSPSGPCPVRGSFLFHRAPDGRCVEINAVLSDLSDFLSPDLSFQAAQQAVERAAAAQLTYLENISHEVRTPLNGILGAVAALQERFRDDPTAGDLLDLLSIESNRLQQLLDSMLAARPSSIGQDHLSVNQPVLLVDDVASNLKVLQLALRGLGFKELQTALSGEEGWDIWQQMQQPLVLLDYRMEGMSGYDLCRLIRAHAHGAKPIIIGVSANALPENEALAYEAGFNAQMAKPVSRLKLRSVLEKLGYSFPPTPASAS